MKIVHCSTSVSNSSANIRLQNALIKSGVTSNTLVLFENNEPIPNVNNIGEYGVKYKLFQRVAYYVNILDCLFLRKICRLEKGMPYSWIPIGIDISKIDIVQEADIIHLHCINSCYLSLKIIRKLTSLNKPVVITLHDSWFLTGGCHVLNGCEKFRNGCTKCSQISIGSCVCKKHYAQKRKCIEANNVYFTAPSEWTYSNYIKSGLYGKKCTIVGNTLNFDVFKSCVVADATKGDKIRLLFGAVNSTETPYKGFDYLLRMLRILCKEHPELVKKIEVHIFGADKSQEEILRKFDCKFWGYIKNEIKMAEIYNMCDVYVVPSLEDSFNQTVLESCACETPVVSFRTGGICDIIKHKETGYLAEYKNASDLLEGVLWILKENIDNKIGKYARKYVKARFSEELIAQKLTNFYMSLMLEKQERKRNAGC